jgi:hypothetical protein
VTRTWVRGGGGFVHARRGGGAVDDVGSGIRGRKGVCARTLWARESAPRERKAGWWLERRPRSARSSAMRATRSRPKDGDSYTWGPHAGRTSARETGPRSGALKSAHPRARVRLTARARLSAPATTVWAVRGEWESRPNRLVASPYEVLSFYLFIFLSLFFLDFSSSTLNSSLNSNL